MGIDTTHTYPYYKPQNSFKSHSTTTYFNTIKTPLKPILIHEYPIKPSLKSQG